MRSLEIAYQKISSAIIERWLRINTTGYADPVTNEGIHYTPLPYIMVFRLLRLLDLQPDDIFIDIGSGKGRVVCCASRWKVRTVVGIELNEDLVAISRDNLERVRGRQSEARVVHASAEDFQFDGVTAVYLYNPFTERLTAKVVDAIRSSFKKSPRPIRLAYANPVYESAFQRLDWLEKFEDWRAEDYPGFGYPVSFWRTRSDLVRGDD